VQFAVAGGRFGGLGEVAVVAAEVALAGLPQLGADRTPCAAGAGLGDADDDQRQEADQRVSADRSSARWKTGRNIDRQRISAEERLDRKYLLTTGDPSLSAADVALGYRHLLEAERSFPLPHGHTLNEEPVGLGLAQVAP
jgi:hypothetical protein